VLSGFAIAALVLGASPASGNPAFLDPAIAGVVLGDDQSGRAFVEQYGTPLRESTLPLTPLRYVSSANTEILELVIHPGDVVNSFAQFRVIRANGARGPATPTRVSSFVSVKGVHLGLTLPDVVHLLGPPSQRVGTGGTVTLEYRCTSRADCPDLARVNMPEYEGRYVFRLGVLEQFEAGYPYP
jgi:hypothetical protein